MRIAMLSPLFERVPPRLYGGTERVVANLCNGLAKAGIQVELFASGDSSVEGRLIPIIDQALRLRSSPVPDPLAYNFKMLSLVARSAEDFDVIHNHHDYWMLPLSEMTRTPLLTTTHGRMDLPGTLIAFSEFRNSSYISISDAQRTPIPYLPWVKTIHHGIDVNEFTYFDQPGKYLAFLGRMSPEKRPDWAIQIAKNAGIPLRIAAKIEGSESQSYFDTFIKPHIDGHNIEFIGEISETEKSEFLGNAVALVFPIDWPEPFGLVVIESLACGTPVLARPCGSMPELLMDGITGYCHSDLKVLTQRIQDIPKIDRRQCREWVEDRFSLRRMTEDYIHVYRHLAAKKLGSNRHRRNFLHSVQRAANGNT